MDCASELLSGWKKGGNEAENASDDRGSYARLAERSSSSKAITKQGTTW